MDRVTFERKLKRIDERLSLRRGRHPEVERRLKKGRRFRNGFADLRYWHIYETNHVTGKPEVVLTIHDERGWPRDPYDRDIAELLRSQGRRYLTPGHRVPTKWDLDRWDAEHRAVDEQVQRDLDRERRDFIEQEGVDVARFALHRDLRTQYDAGIRVGVGADTKYQHTKAF